MVTTSRIDNALLPFLLSSLTFFFLALDNCSTAVDNTTVTQTQYITDPQTITSSGEIFKLGFFSPANSTNRYVGIWYNKTPTIVWVANKDNPLSDSSYGIIKIADDGNLVILNGQGVVLWTTNVSNIAFNNSVAELLDTGNLVLRQASDNTMILWQSFEHPSHTLMPGMMMGGNRRTGKTQQLTSWKTESDPSTGIFTAGMELQNIPQVVIWNNGSQRHWRSGPWNNRIFIGFPKMDSIPLNGFYVSRDAQEDSAYVTFSYADTSSLRRFVLDHNGIGLGETWVEGNGWYRFLSTVDSECDTYGKCGPFGSCNMLDSPICSCLRGFEPKFKVEWSKGNWSGGCVRKMELLCERNRTGSSNRNSSHEGDKEDGFLKLETMKVPDFAYWLANSTNIEECEKECLVNCSCLAYSYESGIGCMTWGGSLVDIQKFPRGGVDLHIRVSHSELDVKKNSEVIIIITVLIGTFTISVCTYFCWRWMVKRRGKQKKDIIEISDQNMLGDNQDLKLFKFEDLAIATNNFSGANKLGEGGFGPVYKGKFIDGEKLAVKRLSKGSGQGLEEFKNEVLVILKLQHRNLVRLLGCCIEEEEKMLIYEYMPNKSLDFFLFGLIFSNKFPRDPTSF